MTLDEYINDPSKSRQENLTTHDFYLAKLNKIIEREKHLPMVSIYYEKDDLWFHFKIPDEEMTGFYFDIVFIFHPDSTMMVNDGNINDYKVTFFSNDPGFVFRYCYEFNQAHLVAEPMKSRLNHRALHEPAVQTNPNHELRYVKTFYFAYLVMEKLSLFDKSTIKAHKVTKLNRSFFVQGIPNDTTIYNKRQTRQKTVKNIDRTVTRITKPLQDMGSKITKSISSVKSTASSKSSKTVSGVKRIKRK